MRSLLRSALWSSHTSTSNWCAFPGRFIPSSSLKKSRALVFITRRHGFNKQTPSLFVQDTIKSSLLNLILEIILYLIIQLILRVGSLPFFSPAYHAPHSLHSLVGSGPLFHCFESSLSALPSPSFQPPHASSALVALRADSESRYTRWIPRKSRAANRQQSTNRAQQCSRLRTFRREWHFNRRHAADSALRTRNPGGPRT